MAKCALYRHFDTDGNLLYVGISYDPFRRTGNHSFNADWFEAVARIEIEWLPTRAQALWFEELAISRENPKCNLRRPAPEGDEMVQPQIAPRRLWGVASRKPEVQEQIDVIIEEAAALGHKLRKQSCLAVVREQLGLIKEGKSPKLW